MKRTFILWQLTFGVLVGLGCRAQTTPRSATATQAGEYRQSSADNGTTINSSNTSNYNSNNVTNAPTGVGSNPAGPPASGPMSSPGGASGKRKAAASGASTTSATGTAIDKAKTSTMPAVSAGSTDRNTSIHDFIASSPNYTTLQNALQAADLFDTLKESQAYTLFAPTNDAFKKLPAAAQNGLLEGRNKPALTALLRYHLVKGSLSADDLRKRIKNNGTATLKTVAGEPLTISAAADGQLILTDQTGNKAMINEVDQRQANGYVHGISAVLMTSTAAASIR